MIRRTRKGVSKGRNEAVLRHELDAGNMVQPNSIDIGGNVGSIVGSTAPTKPTLGS